MNCGEILRDNICERCELPFCRQFCIGLREGALKELINAYKFRSVRAAYFDLAEMLYERTGALVGYKIVPLPTITKHVRERGFDHIGKLAKQLARLSGGELCFALERNINSTQVGADKQRRILQAQKAFRVSKKMEPGADYLLLDDI